MNANVHAIPLFAALTLAVTPAVYAAEPPEDQDRPNNRRPRPNLLERFDTNDDGKITFDEAAARSMQARRAGPRGLVRLLSRPPRVRLVSRCGSHFPA